MKKNWKIIAVMVAALAAAVVALVMAPSGKASVDDAPTKSRVPKHLAPKKHADKAVKSNGSAQKTDGKRKGRRITRPATSEDFFDHLSGVDKEIAVAIDKAFDDDDFKGVAAAAQRALSCTNSEVRMNAVEALGWFGEKALPELTLWMSDKDEEVAQEAMNQWSSALGEVEKPEDRFSIAATALNTLADADALETIGFELSSTASELIDGEDDEDKAKEYRTQVVETLADIILNGQAKNQAAAKEAYSDITGNDWISVEEAEKYLKDPDNYEPPDEDADNDASTDKDPPPKSANNAQTAADSDGDDGQKESADSDN